MKDVIYPTVKQKFDELTLRQHFSTDTFFFVDDKGNNQIAYNRMDSYIAIRLDYFMLHYFGFEFGVRDKDLNHIFMGLLRNRLGEDFHDWKVSHDKIDYV